MKTVIFDMHGIIFSFSEVGDVEESSKILESSIKKLSEKSGRFKSAVNDDFVFLEAEYKIVWDFLNGYNDVCIYEMSGALDRLLGLYEDGYQIVIVSCSKVETTKMILEYLLGKKENFRGSAQILYSFEIYNSLDYGLKNDKLMWKKILEKYEDVVMIYEDKKEYLDVALEVAKELKFKCKGFNKI